MDRLLTTLWLAILALLLGALAHAGARAEFEAATRAHPYLLGFAKIALLGTMGELLGKRVSRGAWQLSGIRLWQRALVWGFLGLVFAAVFPLFSFGVEGLLEAGLLPGAGAPVAVAFWKSAFMNLIFAFPMMVFHRVTDGLIDRAELFSSWPLVEVFTAIDWRTMFRVVGGACLWFWIPAHTGTFLLPPEYRVLGAALLAIALGLILGLANRRRAEAALA